MEQTYEGPDTVPSAMLQAVPHAVAPIQVTHLHQVHCVTQRSVSARMDYIDDEVNEVNFFNF